MPSLYIDFRPKYRLRFNDSFTNPLTKLISSLHKAVLPDHILAHHKEAIWCNLDWYHSKVCCDVYCPTNRNLEYACIVFIAQPSDFRP
jgi:hypothetical protein